MERDFYTYLDTSGRANDAVERWFSAEIESTVAESLRALQAGTGLQPEWVASLSAFVVSSLLRTATVRSFMDQIDSYTRPLLVLHEQARRLGLDLAALTDRERRRLLEVTREAVSRVGATEAEERKSRLRTMLRKVDEWTAMLNGWDWEVLRAVDPTLITGDAPVAVLGSTPVLGWAGVLPSDSAVALPITPLSLLMASPLPLIGHGAVTRQLAGQVNDELVRNCFKAVFHHPETTWPPDLRVPPHRPRLAEPLITWRSSPPESTPTFPARYPDVQDASIRELLSELGAQDEVE